ncbi:hypothetical protein LIER_10602 [Lithospermum erythrorhizon]|uniref:Uncharacterized protein n=1 Tax=Lithospermum erythrorhizon TaxID=34254 RepID=A0AAV3PM68_LITER
MGFTLAAPSTTVASLGRGLLTKHPLVLLQDYVTHTVHTLCPSSPSTSPLDSPAVLTGVEPRNFSEAMSDPGWREAMSQEICALETNKT